MIDYVAELERLKHQRRWLICDPAIDATRRLRFPTPHIARLMGDVWNALDAWIVAGRPQAKPGYPTRDTEYTLALALARFYAASYFHELDAGQKA